MCFISRWNELKSIMIRKKLIYLYLFFSIVFASGGYDHGTAAGKGNWDISLTWNPFNYFDQGQSYAVLGYGLTNRLVIHILGMIIIMADSPTNSINRSD
jgi:hypothetical protein